MPVHTFNDWKDPVPGFCEVDMVAHGGTSVAGSFNQTLTMVDVATGWTECLPLVTRDGVLVIDYRHCSPAGLHTLNSSPEGVIGGYFCLVSQTLSPGEKINSGQYLGSQQVFQPGSVLDPQNPHMAHGYAWYSLAAALTAAYANLRAAQPEPRWRLLHANPAPRK